jgi:hypothetical protein
MVGGADDLTTVGLVLDAVHDVDDLERLLRLWHFSSFEELSSRVREAAAALARAFLLERVISAVVVA